LFDKTKTTLIKYPEGKTGNTFTIPNGVTYIWYNAFSGCTSLTSLTIPNGVTDIWFDAFRGCTSLTSVIIGSGVDVIGGEAFEECSNLTSVTFVAGSNIHDLNFGDNVFPEGADGYGGNTLKTAYSTGKAGTYTRTTNGSTWTKTSN